jgi:hypothetical protein
MKTIAAILSMLHQPAGEQSATRLFRGKPALWWTLRRLGRASSVGHTAVLCWEDQLASVRPIAAEAGAFVLAKGPRCAIASMDAITAALRWADGWRGGLLGACHCDLGFVPSYHNEICRHFGADAVLLVDPDAGLIDAALVDSLVAHARAHPSLELCFSPAAPGLSATLLSAELLDQLAASGNHPGRLLNYWPDLPGRDPISREHCAPVVTAAARTLARFTLHSRRAIRRMESCTVSLNGQLLNTAAEQLVSAVAAAAMDPLPRDVTLELNTQRLTRPIYAPARHLELDRPELSLELARRLFVELGELDDSRLTLAGVGDPLLARHVFEVIQAAHSGGIRAIHIETDLACEDAARAAQLAELPVDVVSVHIPAASEAVYEQVMGRDLLGRVIENLRALLSRRQELGRGTPIVVPTFTKCRQNLHEMEAWYDHWLRAVGCAVIVGPSDYAGQIPDCAVADMSPPGRCPCRRLSSRATILCDGSIVACEQDAAGRQPLGRIGVDRISKVWAEAFSTLRDAHQAGRHDAHPLCSACREWHRP